MDSLENANNFLLHKIIQAFSIYNIFHLATQISLQMLGTTVKRNRKTKWRKKTTCTELLLTISLLIGILCPLVNVVALDPKFDISTRMRLVLVPADAQVGSVIYRLRASDEEFDYPLTFEFVGDASSSTVKIESLPCTKYNSVCQANVILTRRLEPGRYYDFQVSVKDTKGGMTTQLCSITATNFTTPHDLIFPHKPGIIMIPEDAKRGTELDYVIARKNPLFQKPVYLELWGSPLFAIRQKIVSNEATEGTVFLLGPLDFEKQAMYHLTILANDAYAEPGQDSRNIAGMEIVLIVQDVQDQPPVFTLAPPVTKLPTGLLPGDKILQVHAEDGDKGNPREVRYGLVSEGNPFTSFFDINDTSGEIFLMRPLEDIAAIIHIGDPVLLTVIAEEVKVGRDEPPAMASTVQLAFFLPERTNTAPYFENDHYVSRVDENAPQGTALTFIDPYVPRVYDDDVGKNGVFSLTLLNNNGTFEISPNVAERSASFLIRVRDNLMLDYEERHSVQFQVLAQELGPATNLSAIVNITVYINDVNDNPPIFNQPVYTVELPENMTIGTKVVQVHADDVDTGAGGSVRYTAILGYLNTSLNLDADTGFITVSTNNHGFDREVMPEYHLYVEARDNDGTGNRAQVPLVIKLIDVNDETPKFEKDLYEFILALDLKSFTSPAFIHAIDKDASAPNNEVRYEIINGNYDNKFNLNKETGELTVVDKIVFRNRRESQIVNRSRRQLGLTASDLSTSNNMFLLTARAYDLGVPVRFSTTTIRIYPPESRTRTVTFLVPGLQPNKAKTEETLSTITGGRVVIHEIRPVRPDEAAENPTLANNKSVVTATVLYDSSSVVDIYQIQQRLSQHNSSFAIMTHDMTETDNLTPLQTLYKAENKLLFWLLILLATLVGLTILVLLLCCICSWCPLYAAASKRIVNINRTEDDVHLVHREMANGKQAKSVQVAEWAGRREAWSAEKPSDPRTKPTRWEFRDGRGAHTENIEHPMSFPEDTEEIGDRRHALAEERLSRVRIKNSHTAKEDNHNSFHNSRTNLINEKDVYIEDVNDDVEIIDKAHRYNNKIRRRQQQQQQQQSHHDRQQHKKIYTDNDVNNIDDDSMRRHEIDRGSDIDYNTGRSSLKNKREFFLKDGNIEILQLVTRDKTHDMSAIDDENIYVNVPPKSNLSQPHLLMIDNSGKEILMRRFIEEQPDGKQIIREHYQIVPGATYIQSMPNEIQQNSTLKGDTFPLGKSEPNSIIYSQVEPEVKIIHTQPAQNAILTNNETKDSINLHGMLQPSISNQSLTQELETSLKQQNALLRQILLEKEKFETRYVSQQEIAMETQSLPGQNMAIATQTDCEAATQTDAEEMHGTQRSGSTNQTVTLRRKARSENDDSLSEDEYEYIPFSPPNNPEGIYFIKRKRQKKRMRRNGTQPRKRIIMVEEVKRKIRTPITEEGEEFYEYRKRPSPKKPLRYHGETKASILRRKKNEANKVNCASPAKNVHLKGHDVLIQISDSMDEQIHYAADNSYHINNNLKNNNNNINKNSSSSSSKKHIVQNEEEYYDTDEDIDNYERRTEYSVDSDTDEIVIKSDGFGNASHSGTHHRFEIHVGEDQNTNTLPMSEQQSHAAYDSVTQFSRGVSYRRSNSLNGSNSHHSTQDEPKHSITINNMSTKEAAKENRDSKKRKKNYKSETDLLEGTDKTIPKYMEWYYSNKKQQPSVRTITEAATTKYQAPTKRGSEQIAEKRITKTRINTKSDTAVTITNSKPEPAPRKSPPKGSRMLKEDMALSKQVKNKTENDANHPLVQHSEHRFERENATEVPAPPTKLPHYMYPETPPFAGSSKVHVSQRHKPKPSPIKENELKISKSKINVYIEDPKATTRAPSTSSLHTVQKQLNVSTLEDDHDSGIAMNSLLNSMGRRNPIADKKSVFSIAYDNVSQVKKIQSDVESPNYS